LFLARRSAKFASVEPRHATAAADLHTPRNVERRRANRRKMTAVLWLLAVYMVAEAVGGWISGSLALLADAAHMLSDVAALGLALFAIWVGERPASGRRTFGFYRGEILAALANGAALGAIAVLIFVQAVQRLRAPSEVEGGLMAVVAAGGLLVNLIALWLLHSDHDHSLNVRAAWLHLIGDTLGSVGALASAILIRELHWTWSDPAASIAISLLIVFSSWSLLRETVAVLMESAPGHIDVDELRAAMLAVEGSCEIRDLHVWTITSGYVALAAHVCIRQGSDPRAVRVALRELLCDRFGIDHATIELDDEERR
jgi:cobalt-zinc-cadmium efflux system protein